jgi:hypothetical protein
VAIAYRHVNDQPEPPSAHHPGVPPELEAVAMRALAKDPSARYQTAEELRNAVVAARGAGVVTAPMGAAVGDTELLPAAGPEATTPIGTEPLGRRRPGLPSWLPLALIAAAVLALAGILALSLASDQERRGQRGGGGQQQPPPEEESPPTEELPPPDQALAAFQDLLANEVSEGRLTFEAAEEISNKANEAGTKYFEGELEAALDELSKAHEEVDKALSEGEIASEDTAVAIHEAIDVVAASMQAAPIEPPAEEGDGEGEEGGGPPPESEGKGEEKGKGKDGDE